MPDTPFAEIAVALGVQARELAHRAEQNEHVAHAIGLFPATTNDLVKGWRRDAELLGEAHRLLLALMPVEETVRAVITASGGVR